MERPLRVLIVEDNEDDCALVLRELRRGGYDVTWERVENAAAMTAALERGGWDVILSDFSLPNFSAPEALALAKAREVDVPFLIVSGTVGELEAVESLKAGAHDFLSKQSLTRLCPAVARELRESAERRARQLAEARRREMEERYRLLVEQIPAVLYIASASQLGKVLYVSPQIEALLGFPVSDWMGRELWGRQTHAEDVAAVDAAFARLRTSGEKVTADYRMIARDGRHVWVRDEARLVPTGDDGVPVVQGILQDITELKRAEAEMDRQREALSQTEKIAALGQLLAGVAHELNNPLSVVLGQAGLLRRILAGRPEDARVEKIELAAERCARIVKDFLALARQQAPSRAAVSVSAIVRATLELLAYPLSLDGIQVKLDIASDLAPLWADGHQLQQVLLNLITNAQHALRASPAPRQLAISTRAVASGGPIAIEVADNGPGIPAELQARIFEPFFTTKPAGEGTGLGLSICKGIVESHGGTLAIESAPGAGARFRIELPLGEPIAARAAAGQRRAPAAARRARSILIVDDEAAVAELLADLLASEGHRITTAAGGRAALERLEREEFDLILSDMRMPELDGSAFYLEAERRHPGVGQRFVFLTGDLLAPGTREFLERTGRPHVAKPFEIDEVQRVVEDALLVAP